MAVCRVVFSSSPLHVSVREEATPWLWETCAHKVGARRCTLEASLRKKEEGDEPGVQPLTSHQVIFFFFLFF